MSFNYGARKKQFEKEWAETRKRYKAAGMSDEAIQAMYEYDWEQFKAERIWALHTQSIPEPKDDEEDMYSVESPLLERFLDRMSNEYDAFGSHSRYWWVQEIASIPVARVLQKFSSEDIELLTLSVFEGYTLSEIALRLNLPRSTIAWRIEQRLKDIEIASSCESA
jgi:DNA-directed RNA polymerase specialized sigma24 family protein